MYGPVDTEREMYCTSIRVPPDGISVSTADGVLVASGVEVAETNEDLKQRLRHDFLQSVDQACRVRGKHTRAKALSEITALAIEK